MSDNNSNATVMTIFTFGKCVTACAVFKSQTVKIPILKCIRDVDISQNIGNIMSGKEHKQEIIKNNGNWQINRATIQDEDIRVSRIYYNT